MHRFFVLVYIFVCLSVASDPFFKNRRLLLLKDLTVMLNYDKSKIKAQKLFFHSTTVLLFIPKSDKIINFHQYKKNFFIYTIHSKMI